MKEYKNKVIVFPVGMKLNADERFSPCYNHTIKNSRIVKSGRRQSLKIGNAIRMKHLIEDTTFDNCVIFLEGTLTGKVISPFGFYSSMLSLEVMTEG